MKGIVYEYKKEGFGFILDENYHSRFFHINDVREKSKFIENLHDFLYRERIDNQCFFLDFTPYQNKEGKPKAIRINLTDEVLNKKIPGTIFEAEIEDIKYDVQEFSRIVQGIKKGESAPLFTTAGSNGTYRLGYPEVFRELIIDFKRTNNIGWGTVHARDLALRFNNRSKITTPFVEALNRKLKGKTVNILALDNQWKLEDPTILKL